MKSFKPKDDAGGDDDGPGRNAERDFHRQKRSNDTHVSTTDADARLYKKADGQPSRLCFVGTALMENRNGLVVDGRLVRASGVSECLAAIDLADAHIHQGATLAGDKGFDTADFVAELRGRRITPHVAQNAYDTGKARRRSNIDGRTTRMPATAPASNAASASRKSSASASPGSEASTAPPTASISPSPPTTLRECPSCSSWRPDDAGA